MQKPVGDSGSRYMPPDHDRNIAWTTNDEVALVSTLGPLKLAGYVKAFHFRRKWEHVEPLVIFQHALHRQEELGSRTGV